ncbi:MAG: dTMP kinase [Mariprofundaceae bacterium]
MQGRLITFEGGEGCGKSTQVQRTAEWLRGRGERVVTTFEPGDTPLGGGIRQLLLSGVHTPVAEAELFLFLADRAQHVRELIQPALDESCWVLCDRYTDSTLAYQMAGRNLNEEDMNAMLSFAEIGSRPALTLWLDVDLDTGMQRMRERDDGRTRLDDESRAFHARVHQAFAMIHAREPSRMIRVDAGGDIETVQNEIRQALLRHFAELA